MGPEKDEAMAGRTRPEGAATVQVRAASPAGTITCCTVDLTSGDLPSPD